MSNTVHLAVKAEIFSTAVTFKLCGMQFLPESGGDGLFNFSHDSDKVTCLNCLREHHKEG